MSVHHAAAPLIRKLASTLRRDRDLSMSTLVRKVVNNVFALVSARIHLRSCHSVGARARCFGRPHVDTRGKIVIGDDFATGGTFGTVHLAAAKDGTLTIGNSVTTNYGTTISARVGVHIGDRVKIGPYCVVSDCEMPLALDSHEGDHARAIHIGSDVWLGARVTVLPGARIGDGAVIAAGSVVSGAIPPRAVASGVPARVLRVGDARVGDARVEASPEKPVLRRESADVAA